MSFSLSLDFFFILFCCCCFCLILLTISSRGLFPVSCQIFWYGLRLDILFFPPNGVCILFCAIYRSTKSIHVLHTRPFVAKNTTKKKSFDAPRLYGMMRRVAATTSMCSCFHIWNLIYSHNYNRHIQYLHVYYTELIHIQQHQQQQQSFTTHKYSKKEREEKKFKIPNEHIRRDPQHIHMRDCGHGAHLEVKKK